MPAKQRVVTVAIPVYNGARNLQELLPVVCSQKLDEPAEIEILISDSGSTDGSAEIAEQYGARVIRIEKTEFQHGATRNMLVREARGDIVALLTQDATPVGDRWLASILEGFRQADDVALVFGPHIARPAHSPSIAREMIDHFKTWGDGERVDLQRLDFSPAGITAYRAFPGAIQFFSDVNGAVAKWAWERVPYREIPYAEDQLIGREMIEAGFSKVFHPGAAVYHSHDYGALDFMKRYFDEYRSLREVLGHVETANPRHIARNVVGLTRVDRWYMRSLGYDRKRLNIASLRAARHHLLRGIGAALGARSDKLPRRLRGLLSLEGRDSFEQYEIPASPLAKVPERGASTKEQPA